MATAVLEAAAELLERESDEAPQFEIIEGKKVEMPQMGVYSVRVANRINVQIAHFANAHDLGESGVEMLFDLRLPRGRIRRPDVAFVSYERWPRTRPMPFRGNAWDVVPNLAVEVVSPNELAVELMEKVEEYFRAGVQLVWIIYPTTRVAQVLRSMTDQKMLTAKDELDGEQVLPGFRMPLADLFPPQEAEPPSNGDA